MLKNRLWIALLAIAIVAISVVGVSAAHVNRSSAQPAADPTCASSSPCIQYQNTSSGPAIRGIGGTGNGLSGEAPFNSTSASNGRAGVIGADTSSSGTFNSGVKGTSTNGTGVSGTSTNGVGISATSTNSNALVATTTSTSEGAISASGTQNDGIDSVTTNNSTKTEFGRSGIYAHDASTDGGNRNFGVYGLSINGTGVEGISDNFVGVNAVGGLFVGGSVQYPALSIVGTTSCSPSCSFDDPLIEACPSGTANPCDNVNAVFYLDPLGDINISGVITTAGSCKTGCSIAHSPVKQAVRFYTPRESLPTVEDFGEAQLTAGHAYVRMDPAFADTIDQNSNYLVFITPEGDANALFVSQKSGSGFAVTESRGGRDSLAFQYRIVAKPYGENAPRLQRFTIHLPRHSQGNNQAWHPGAVVPLHQNSIKDNTERTRPQTAS
jgi:hypothetical protein